MFFFQVLLVFARNSYDLGCFRLLPYMFIPLLVLAALQIPDKIQTWLLYHNALSEGVLIDTILKQARQTQKTDMEGHATGLAMTEPSSQAIAELRSKVDEQQQMLGRLLVSSQPEVCLRWHRLPWSCPLLKLS